MQEVLGLLPHEHEDGLGAGQTVVGKLHHKRNCLGLVDGLVRYERHEHADDDAREVQAEHHEAALAREERRAEVAIDRELGGAAHERRERDGELAVALGRQRAGGHDGGHRAAKSHEHGHDGAAGQADLAQQLVHEERDARHVARVLQEREEEEHGHDDRRDGQHRADGVEDAADHEGVQHRVHASGREAHVSRGRERVDARCDEILQREADDVEREEEHGPHDEHEHGDGRVPSGQHAVDLAASLQLARGMRLHDRGGHDLLDKREAHVRDGGGAVQAALLLHLVHDVLHGVELVLVQRKGLPHVGVALHQLRRRKAHGDVRADGVVLYQVHDRVQAAVHGAAVVAGVAEVLPAGKLLVARHMDRVAHELVHALALDGGYGHHGNAQHVLHQVHVDRAAVALDLVHHVEREHHGLVQLHQLHRQVQVALDVRGVHDVDDGVWLLLQYVLAAHELLRAVRGERVDARQVRHVRVGVPLDGTALAVHRDAGEVAHVLVRARELVEERGLAAVLVAREREAKHFSLRHRMRVVARAHVHLVGQAVLAKARMPDALVSPARDAGRHGARPRRDANLARVRDAQRELVAVDAELHGVAHGRVLLERDLRAGDDAHVQEVLAERALPSHDGYGDGLADLHRGERALLAQGPVPSARGRRSAV